MKALIHAAAFALLSTPALAQDVTELAQQYVDMPEVQNMITQMFSPEAMAAQTVASLPPGVTMTETQQARVGAVLSAAMTDLRPRLQEIMVSGSAEVFSAAEMQALIDFYGSEHGAAVMGKMSPFMANTMGALAPEMQEMQAKVMPQIIKIMQETE